MGTRAAKSAELDLEKSRALLAYLRQFVRLRRKRQATYSLDDTILWLGELEDVRGLIRSPFFADQTGEPEDIWLEVKKPLIPPPPPPPTQFQAWIKGDKLHQTDTEPEWGWLRECAQGSMEEWGVSELRPLWEDYLANQWRPWAARTRVLKKLEDIFQRLHFMRRRLEEAAEIHELVLATALVIWKDPSGELVRRHLLTAPAEISLDARRGLITVSPVADLDQLRVELDMFELHSQPKLDHENLNSSLRQLAERPWDIALVEQVVNEIANRIDPKAKFAGEFRRPILHSPDEVLHVYYAPAIVLRRRRPFAYDELVANFERQAAGDAAFVPTQPWLRLIREGSQPEGADQEPSSPCSAQKRLYFPLATNEEQKSIAARLQSRPYVLVKGPPGTGKSHTIANLICHLLAEGERVLITAPAARALEVLLGLLPSEIASLCVTALGSTREDHGRLEDNVRAILARKGQWRGCEHSAATVQRLERQLAELESLAAEIDGQIRELREGEAHPHHLYGGYHGTPAQIARALEAERENYGWFPELSDEHSSCPLSSEELAFLASIHPRLNEAKLNEINQVIGPDSLPSPEEVGRVAAELGSLENRYRQLLATVNASRLTLLETVPTEALLETLKFLHSLDEHAALARQRLGAVADLLIGDLLAGRRREWMARVNEWRRLLGRLREADSQLENARIQLPTDKPLGQLSADAERRLAHFKAGGRRGFGPLAPAVVRETRYIEQACRVNELPPRRVEQLEQLLAFIRFKEALQEFECSWPGPLDLRRDDTTIVISHLGDLCEPVDGLLDLLGEKASAKLAAIPLAYRATLADEGSRHDWMRTLQTELAGRDLQEASGRLATWEAELRRVLSDPNAHRCVRDLYSAIRKRDPEAYAAAWRVRGHLKQQRGELARYEALLVRLQEAHPPLAELIRRHQGDPAWQERLHNLERAWAWASARKWLERVADPRRYEELQRERQVVQQRIEDIMAKLVAEKAWQHFFVRLDDATEQNLVAWVKTIARIGKGSGPHAFRHRRQARQYLLRCLPHIPAWIMPLHKVWETVEALPGLFDTVIVDEASQAGVDALLLLLLAKRIVVVGDDQQNSPEGIGVLEADLDRLQREYLGEFTFAAEYRPDTSLYDHAERAFGQPVSLREHFRCVPEIIRFSNDLCYREVPLIPLRQPPPDRLEPIRTKFVDRGHCTGDGYRLINRPEAEEIVSQIQACVEDERYADKTMGVIVLQGHQQAELIEDELARVLTPKAWEKHKLRCGVPATFQGDQRDVIFLSMVVAPNYDFRALTEHEARRRFNVAMSRARDQVWLFHSVRLEDLRPDDLRSKLLRYCLNWKVVSTMESYADLMHLEREVSLRSRSPGTQPEPYESWFEVDMALELLRRGYRLRPQYEFGGYRIDLVVEGSGNRLAVECDGDDWHGPEKFEQDMHRQRQLERAGWSFVRIRASEFYANRESAVDRIVKACEELDIIPGKPATAAVDNSLPRVVLVRGKDVCAPQAAAQEVDDNEDQDLPYQPTLEQGRLDTLLPDPRVAPVSAVRDALLKLIRKEGPLNKRLLYRLYVMNCPQLQRATDTVKNLLNRALYQLQRSNQVIVVDELGDRTPESLVVRLVGSPPASAQPRTGRDLLEIPPTELLALREKLRRSFPAGFEPDEQQMMRAVLDHYGFQRLTKGRREYLQRVFRSVPMSAPAAGRAGGE